jgi:hypothetical protein
MDFDLISSNSRFGTTCNQATADLMISGLIFQSGECTRKKEAGKSDSPQVSVLLLAD